MRIPDSIDFAEVVRFESLTRELLNALAWQVEMVTENVLVEMTKENQEFPSELVKSCAKGTSGSRSG